MFDFNQYYMVYYDSSCLPKEFNITKASTIKKLSGFYKSLLNFTHQVSPRYYFVTLALQIIHEGKDVW
jgi:hypothetical protein